ncbi:MAG: sulfur oxidation c-type cytochrome SoxA [Halothiobacillaceae bacterium]|nr:sulfur oxidation c-type cytochrome SoxA [Halothiobacillaceae bacterium]HER34066.1 sulfur oxidation c-type cytochrome SoxA [Halothiobacillaceae bacterium]
MKRLISSMLAASVLATGGALAADPANPSDPEEFRQLMVDFYQDRYPDVPFEDYNMSVYAIDADARSQWEGMMIFPQTDEYVAKGEKLWNEYRLPNGKPLSSCLGEAKGLRAKYPYFSEKDGEVHSLGLDIINCQKNAGEDPENVWDPKNNYKKLANVLTYLASESNGMTNKVQIDSEGAKEAYNRGKEAWFNRTGRLDNSCADCHQYHGGQYARAEHLHMNLGNTTHFPAFRYSKGSMFTLHKRIYGCIRDTGTIPPDQYSEYARNLEFFMSFNDNGLELNGPNIRK